MSAMTLPELLDEWRDTLRELDEKPFPDDKAVRRELVTEQSVLRTVIGQVEAALAGAVTPTAEDFDRAADVLAIAEERDKAYRERAALVAYLAACYPSEMAQEHEGDPWPVVCVLTPAGQMSWHIARDDLRLVDHVGWHGYEWGWDGHTTEEKYERLAKLTRTTAASRTEPCPGCESLRRQCSELAGELGAALGVLRDISDTHQPGTFAHDVAHQVVDRIHAGQVTAKAEAAEPPKRYALVEQMGHRATVGTVRETTFAGKQMLAVTDLGTGTEHLVSPESLYEVTWLTEEQARSRATPWTARALPAGGDDDDPWQGDDEPEEG